MFKSYNRHVNDLLNIIIGIETEGCLNKLDKCYEYIEKEELTHMDLSNIMRNDSCYEYPTKILDKTMIDCIKVVIEMCYLRMKYIKIWHNIWERKEYNIVIRVTEVDK